MDISKLKTINWKLLDFFIYSAVGLPILSILVHIYTETPKEPEDYVMIVLLPLFVSFTCGFFPYLVAQYLRSPLVLYGDSIERFGKAYKWEDVEFITVYNVRAFLSTYPRYLGKPPSIQLIFKRKGMFFMPKTRLGFYLKNTEEVIQKINLVFSQVQKHNIDIYSELLIQPYSEEVRAEFFRYSEELEYEYVAPFIPWEKILPCLYFCILLGAIWTIYMVFYINMF